MPERVSLTVNGRSIEVVRGASVAAAVVRAGVVAFRRSVTGEPRAPLCSMGVCYECRVTIDGVRHRLSCQTPCAAGMEVVTDAS